MRLIVRRSFIFILYFTGFCTGQVNLSIVEYRPFPEKISLLDIEPTQVKWSIANRFLLLDENKRELLELGPFGDVNLAGGLGRQRSRYGELVWMGISPEGIRVVDRLENEIAHLDYRLNPVQTVALDQRIFPEMAALDPWGRLFMYTRTYNGIYIFEKSHLDKVPFISFSKEFSSTFCMKAMEINQDGELAVLGCDGIFHYFTQNGQRQASFPSTIEQAEFLVSVRRDWLIFNREGHGISVNSQAHLSIPGSSVPVIDIASMNRSIAVLSKDHILILDVK